MCTYMHMHARELDRAGPCETCSGSGRFWLLCLLSVLRSLARQGPRAPGKEKQVLPFDCKVPLHICFWRSGGCSCGSQVEPVEDRRQVQGDDSVKRGAGSVRIWDRDRFLQAYIENECLNISTLSSCFNPLEQAGDACHMIFSVHAEGQLNCR